MTANILDLSYYRVGRVDETEHDYHIHAETAYTPTSCAHCRSTSVARWGARDLLFKDLPMHGKRVGIYVRARRLRCDDCGRTFMEPLPGLSESRKMTQRLCNWIGQQSLKRPFTSIADEVGVDERTVRNVFRDYRKRLARSARTMSPCAAPGERAHFMRLRSP
jgi:transposase